MSIIKKTETVIKEHRIKKNVSRKKNSVIYLFASPADRPSVPRAKCMTAKADCSPTAGTCVTVWMWTVWAASTPAPNAARAGVEWSAAVIGSGFMSRWRWRVERSYGTSLLFS